MLTKKVLPYDHSWAEPCLTLNRLIRRLAILSSVFCLVPVVYFFLFNLAKSQNSKAPDLSPLSMRVTWCQKQADYYNRTSMYARISLKHGNRRSVFPVNLQTMEFRIQGLQVNTEYLLLFKVYSSDYRIRRPLIATIMAERLKTNSHCKFLSLPLPYPSNCWVKS